MSYRQYMMLIAAGAMTILATCYVLGLVAEGRIAPTTILRTTLVPYLYNPKRGDPVTVTGAITRQEWRLVVMGRSWTTSSAQFFELWLKEPGTGKTTGILSEELEPLLVDLRARSAAWAVPSGSSRVEWQDRYILSTMAVGALRFWQAPITLAVLWTGLLLARVAQSRRRFMRLLASQCTVCGYSYPAGRPSMCHECGSPTSGGIDDAVLATRMNIARRVIDGTLDAGEVVRRHEISQSELLEWIDAWYRLRRQATRNRLEALNPGPSKPSESS